VRVMTIAGRWLAAVLGLSVLCIVLALVFFNPNAYRDEIQAWVSEQTGRGFTLDGELGWQVWPRLTVTLPHMQLGSAPGATKAGNPLDPFAEWQQAGVSVRLWPLVHGRLEFGAVQLRGLRLRLQRDAADHNNWQDLLELLTADRPPGRFKFTSLAGLQVDDAEITFDDAAVLRMSMLRIASLQTTAVTFGQPVSVTLKAHASTRAETGGTTLSDNQHSQSIDIPFTLDMQMQTDAALQRWQLESLEFATQMTATGTPAGGAIDALPVTLRLQHADWQTEQQQLMLNALLVAVGDAQLTTDQMQLTQLNATPRIAAALQFEVPNFRQWLQHLGVEVPTTRDTNVLQHLSAQLQATGSLQDLRLQVMPLLLDQTRWSGEARWQHAGGTARYTFELRADQLDLDRYLPATQPADVQKPLSAPVPIDWLRSMHAQGRLNIDKAQWQAIRAQHLTITLDGS
jgi:AsmA protein